VCKTRENKSKKIMVIENLVGNVTIQQNKENTDKHKTRNILISVRRFEYSCRTRKTPRNNYHMMIGLQTASELNLSL